MSGYPQLRSQRLLGAVLRVSLLAAIAAAGYFLRIDGAAIGFLMLVAIVWISLDSGFITSAVLSFLSVAVLDFFFFPPRFSFTLESPLDIITLSCFLVTSLLVTRLASRERRQSNVSRLRRQQMETLYDLARDLLALEPEAAPGAAFLACFLSRFDLRE